MKTKTLLSLLSSLLLSIGSAEAQITVVDSAFAVKGSAAPTFVPADLGGFDPAGADKLIVTVHDEGSGGAGGITYNGQALNRILDQTDGARHAEVWYLDYDSPAAQGDLVISGSLGVSILAVSGTADGFGAVASIGGSSSVNLDALVDDSLVVAAFTNNNTAATVQSPLTPLLGASVGSSAGASGWTVAAAGVQAYSFTGGTGNRQAAAVAFPEFGADAAAPALASSTPPDGATNVLTDLSQITINFDEGIVAGSAGTLALKKVAGDATVASWDISEVVFDLTSITVSLDSVLEPSTAYYFDLSSGLLGDFSGNTAAYADSSWEFTTGVILTQSLESESNSGSYTFDVAAQEGFDASSSDKLVAVVSSRRNSSGTFTGFTATYGGLPMNVAVEEQSNVAGDYHAGIFYLDNPPATGDLVVGQTGSGNRRGVAVTLMALSGTLDGVADTDARINANSAGVAVLTDGGHVIAAGSDGVTLTTNSPLIPTLNNFDNGNAKHAHAYEVKSPAGPATPTLSGASEVTVAAVFEPDAGDVTDPTLTSSTPSNGASGVSPFNLSLVLNLSETVRAGTGNIEVYRSSDDTLVETLDVTSDAASFAGSSVTVFLGSFEDDTAHYVNIDSGAIIDAPGNAYVGISNDSLLVFTTAALPSGAINVDFAKEAEDEGNASTYTFSSADLGGFDATASDKLVVSVSSEGSSPVTSLSATYGGAPMIVITSENSGSGFGHHAAILYLDSPSVAGDLVINHGVGRSGVALSALALTNTTAGVAVTASPSLGASTTLTTNGDDSLVFAANVFNGGSGSTPQAPLITVLNLENGSASHGSGYQLVPASGTEVTPTFSGGAVTVAAAFAFIGGGIGGDTFADWIGTFGLDAGEQGFDFDADGDGLDNGLEAWFGTDPSVGNPGLSEVAKSGNTLSFAHPVADPALSDVNGSYEWSLDLQNWNDSGDTAGGVSATISSSSTGGTATVTATITTGDPDRLFIRAVAMQN